MLRRAVAEQIIASLTERKDRHAQPAMASTQHAHFGPGGDLLGPKGLLLEKLQIGRRSAGVGLYFSDRFTARQGPGSALCNALRFRTGWLYHTENSFA